MNKSYRNIFKWGDPNHEEALDKTTLKIIKKIFKLSEEDIKNKYLPGYEEVKLKKTSQLKPAFIERLKKIVGEENVATDDFTRASHAFGKYYTDLLYLRMGKIESPPDAVIYPRNDEDVEAIIEICNEEKIPITPFGGHSSVTRGVETPKGGISLDLTRHLNKVIQVDENNSSVTVQAGINGPALEEHLNHYGIGYTCGHFPQSFEYSTVGGWVAARGAGYSSTGYGKMESIVLALKCITPRGIIQTRDYPASAQGWDLNQIFMGSEGTLGVITEVTMKIRKFQPKHTCHTSVIFRNFESAVTAMKTCMQNQFGVPHLFRISDAEETDIAFKMKGFDGTFSDQFLQILGYKPGERCLMLVSIEGDKDYTRFVANKIKKVARRHKAFHTGSSPVKKWLEQRYASAYLRDPLMDLGIMTDTLETSITWENLIPLWRAVRRYIKSRPDTVCMVHISHVYENGANLYFTFLSPMKKGNEITDYVEFHRGIIDTINDNQGSLSHHHGAGRVMAPWMEKQHGKVGMGLMLAIKNYLDPNGIMNPGGMLGLE